MKHTTYHEESEGISNTLHEQLVLAKIIFVDVQELGIVEVASKEQCHEEPYDHIHTCYRQYACTETDN